MFRRHRYHRYLVEFKLKAVGYARCVLEGGRGSDTVGLTYVTRALGILDEATLVSWIKNWSTYKKELASWIKSRSTYEKEVQAATAASETKASRVLAHPLLTPPLVFTPPAFWPGYVHTHSIAIIDVTLSHPLITIPPESGRGLLTLPINQ